MFEVTSKALEPVSDAQRLATRRRYARRPRARSETRPLAFALTQPPVLTLVLLLCDASPRAGQLERRLRFGFDLVTRFSARYRTLRFLRNGTLVSDSHFLLLYIQYSHYSHYSHFLPLYMQNGQFTATIFSLSISGVNEICQI